MLDYKEIISVKAYDNDFEIGCATVDVEKKFLYDFNIYKEYRGKGYGQQFLAHLIDKYDIQNLDCLDDNEVALHIYKKFGFEPTDHAVLCMQRKKQS